MSRGIYDKDNDRLILIAGKEDTSVPTFTMAEWEAMTDDEKAEYDGKLFVISDDFNGMTVDDEFSSTSVRPVQNKVITSEIQTLTNQDDAMLNVLGAKNLLPNRLVSKTAHGVTYTKMEDGSVVLNGTLNAVDTQTFSNGYNDKNIEWLKPLEGKEVILSGGVEHVSLTLAFYDANTLLSIQATGYNGGSIKFTIPSGISSYTGYTYTDSSTATFNNAVLKPMLRLASVADDTYVPYIMTNQELSKRKILASETANANDGQWFAVEQFGGMVLVTLSVMTITLSTYPNGVIATGLPKPKYTTYAFAVGADGTAYRLRINTDGELKLLKESAAALTANATYVTGQFIYFIAT